MIRSRERVWFSTACFLRRRGAGLEPSFRGEMKEPPKWTVPTFVPCNRYILAWRTKERSCSRSKNLVCTFLCLVWLRRLDSAFLAFGLSLWFLRCRNQRTFGESICQNNEKTASKCWRFFRGSGDWIRTSDISVNSRTLYRWATPEYCYRIILPFSFANVNCFTPDLVGKIGIVRNIDYRAAVVFERIL